MNLYVLAENLGMTVTRLKREMTLREYFGWLKYQAQRGEPREPPEPDEPQTRYDDPVMQVFGFLPGGQT